MKSISIIFHSLILITASACSDISSSTDGQNSDGNSQAKSENKPINHRESMTANFANTQSKDQGDGKNYSVGEHVPTTQVCMVNDAFMNKAQIPVEVNNKTYYGCCKMCVKTLNQDESARVGIDPYNNEKIDKTEAYIVLLNESGAVGYFKNKESYEAYTAK